MRKLFFNLCFIVSIVIYIFILLFNISSTIKLNEKYVWRHLDYNNSIICDYYGGSLLKKGLIMAKYNSPYFYGNNGRGQYFIINLYTNKFLVTTNYSYYKNYLTNKTNCDDYKNKMTIFDLLQGSDYSSTEATEVLLDLKKNYSLWTYFKLFIYPLFILFIILKHEIMFSKNLLFITLFIYFINIFNLYTIYNSFIFCFLMLLIPSIALIIGRTLKK